MTSGQIEARAGTERSGQWPLRGLLVWSVGAGFFFLAFLQRVSPSVMVDELMRDFAVSAVILGNLSACYFYVYAAMQLPVGLMIDRIGPRLLLTLFALLCLAGNLIFAFADNVAAAYLGRTLIGAGAAASWVGTLALATRWLPPARFALFAGLGQVFGMAGGVFGQSPLSLAVDGLGWRGALVATAALAGLFAVLFWLVVRDHPADAPRRRADRRPVAERAPATPMLRLLALVARSPQTWLAAAVGLAYTGPMLAFAGLWGVPYLGTAHGFTRTEAAGLVSLFFVGWAVAAPLIGWFSDRTGRTRPILIASGLAGAASLGTLLHLPFSDSMVIGALIFVAGAAGSSMILTFGCAAAANPPEATTAAFGLVNMAVTASGGLLQPLIGWLLDLQWDGRTEAGIPAYLPGDFASALLVLPALSLCGAVAACFMRPTPGRPRA